MSEPQPPAKISPPDRRRPTYRRIADAMRERIIRGDWGPGARLPSTDDLALEWQSTNFTVHSALTTLVKEGWLDRFNGTGTFVSERPRLFGCAGIYHGTDIWAMENRQFTRNVHQALVRRLREKGRTFENFTDPRPPELVTGMLPTMAEAIERRTVDCLIAVTVDGPMVSVLNRLKVPIACVANAVTNHRVSTSHDDLLDKMASALAAQGCRTAGVITSITADPDHPSRDFAPHFRRALRRHGLSTREEWILQPRTPINDDYAPFGYTEFHRLWRLPEKPDGLLIHPDVVVRGAVTAILECGLAAYEGMKFALHRNSHTQVLCPFPATWLITDEDVIARELIAMIERQFAGEKITPVEVSYAVKHERFVLR